MKLPRCRVLLLALLVTVIPVVGSAQEATITGTVTDSTGAVLPGAAIVAINDATGNAFETVTDECGAYTLRVRTGIFHITAKLEGFTTFGRAELELLLGQ